MTDLNLVAEGLRQIAEGIDIVANAIDPKLDGIKTIDVNATEEGIQKETPEPIQEDIPVASQAVFNQPVETKKEETNQPAN